MCTVEVERWDEFRVEIERLGARNMIEGNMVTPETNSVRVGSNQHDVFSRGV